MAMLAYQRVFVGEIAILQRKTRCCSPETSYSMVRLLERLTKHIQTCWFLLDQSSSQPVIFCPGAAKEARIMARRRTQDHRTWLAVSFASQKPTVHRGFVLSFGDVH